MKEYVIKIVLEVPDSESFIHEALMEAINDMGLGVKFMSSEIQLDTGNYPVFEYFDSTIVGASDDTDRQYEI